MFIDPNISAAEWENLSSWQKEDRRIRIRAYFLWANGMPGGDKERIRQAAFADQFRGDLEWMRQQRSDPHAKLGDKLRLVVAEELVGILMIEPRQVTNSTLLPASPAQRRYIMRKVNYHTHHGFEETDFLGEQTVGELVRNLITEYERQRQVTSASIAS